MCAVWQRNAPICRSAVRSVIVRTVPGASVGTISRRRNEAGGWHFPWSCRLCPAGSRTEPLETGFRVFGRPPRPAIRRAVLEKNFVRRKARMKKAPLLYGAFLRHVLRRRRRAYCCCCRISSSARARIRSARFWLSGCDENILCSPDDWEPCDSSASFSRAEAIE